MATITKATVRMYRMGTGDCFIVKFFAGEDEKYTMMIDCGVWSGSKEHLEPFIEDLKTYVDNHVNLLIVTHEHKDHVHVFDACKDLFIDKDTPANSLKVDKIWMGWTEKESDEKVKDWQKKYGEKKKALAEAANKFTELQKDAAFKAEAEAEFNGLNAFAAHSVFSNALNGFSELQNNIVEGVYKGGLEGMRIVKEEIADDNIEYYKAGDIIDNISELPGVSFYVLGPPETWNVVETESGGKGESYDHNKELAKSEAFAAAILADKDKTLFDDVLPFDSHYLVQDDKVLRESQYDPQPWRKIDNEWLNSAGTFALRINSLTNNLSLALAIEIKESKKVMLFPGDAEYGSWASWHTINWPFPRKPDEPHFTEDLLRRTVFYKVAHHLSHHGTAERLGLNMMIHPDLAAMATLDYDVIASGWKGTMPNRALLKDLVAKTKGRLIVTNEKDLFYDTKNTIPLSNQINSTRQKMSAKDSANFKADFIPHELYFQYSVNLE